MRRYIFFHNKHQPKDMGRAEVEAFLPHLVAEGNVSVSTQNQALNALLFLYRNVHCSKRKFPLSKCTKQTSSPCSIRDREIAPLKCVPM
ncbi:MAG: site-specific integrase [Leptolyngbyaceae cyanobacterium MO_188.B28]|nr:site-specific integrase [Leptolyngbyaceae cyanobacterium MO_188.B28]